MNPAHKIIITLMALSILAGCASLDYVQVAPNAAQFHPKVAVILPIKVPSNVQAEADMISGIISNTIAETKKFDRIIDPFTVLTQMGTDKQLQDDITAYLSKIQALGVPDKELSARIADACHADTLFIIEVPKYSFGSIYDSDKLSYMAHLSIVATGSGPAYAEVAINANMVDGASGTVIWKANHGWTWSNVSKMRDLQTMTKRLMKRILTYLPTS